MKTMVVGLLVGMFIFGMATYASAQKKEPRFPELKREQMTDAQKRVYDSIAGGPRGGVRGPRAAPPAQPGAYPAGN